MLIVLEQTWLHLVSDVTILSDESISDIVKSLPNSKRNKYFINYYFLTNLFIKHTFYEKCILLHLNYLL